nr:unnamed protein product [Digitaria exilis]
MAKSSQSAGEIRFEGSSRLPSPIRVGGGGALAVVAATVRLTTPAPPPAAAPPGLPRGDSGGTGRAGFPGSGAERSVASARADAPRGEERGGREARRGAFGGGASAARQRLGWRPPPPPFQAVPTSKGQALADEYGIKFFETSAKTNLNVEQDRTIKIKAEGESETTDAQKSACCGS